LEKKGLAAQNKDQSKISGGFDGSFTNAWAVSAEETYDKAILRAAESEKRVARALANQDRAA